MVMSLVCSFCSKSKGELSDYLVLERPHGRLWTRTSESCKIPSC